MMQRPRRNRKSEAIRNMIAETQVHKSDLIYTLFLVDGNNFKSPIESMPNCFRWSLDLLLHELDECCNLGLQHFVLFPAVDDHLKDKIASYSYHEDNFYLKAIRSIKERFPTITLMSDVLWTPILRTVMMVCGKWSNIE